VVDAGPALSVSNEEEARSLRNVWAQAGDDELPIRIRTVYSWMVRNKAALEPYFAEIAKSDRQTIGDAIYEMVKTDIREELERIDVPVLLVLADGGLQGRYRSMAAGIPELEVVVVPKTRHFVMFDDPAGFTRVVAKFLAARE
jgi:pimeloyl-ACP methyl ester carboxylesterase